MKVENEDINLLKTVADQMMNEMKEGFIFFANIKNDMVNFISRSSNSLDAGKIVKEAAVLSLGNGGGSKTFAQGAGKTTDKLDEIFENIKSEFVNE